MFKNDYISDPRIPVDEKILGLIGEINDAIFNASYSPSDENIVSTQFGLVRNTINNLSVWLPDFDIWELISLTNICIADLNRVKIELERFSDKNIFQIVILLVMICDDSKIQNAPNNEYAFSLFKKVMQNEKLNFGFSKKDFISLYSAVNFFNLEETWKKDDPALMFSDKDTQEIVNLFKTDLKESLSGQLWIACRLYSNDRIDNILFDFPKSRFCSLSNEERKSQIFKIRRLILKKEPIEVLCALVSDRNNGQTAYNDIMLETKVIYRLFQNHLNLKYKSKDGCVVIGASPFFIRRWCKDKNLSSFPITFIVNENEKELVGLQLFNSVYAGVVRSELAVFSTDEYIDIVRNDGCIKYDNILILGENISQSQKTFFLNIFSESHYDWQDLFCLSSDSTYIEYLKKLENYNLSMQDTLILPRGIRNSKRPREKTFWMCSAKSHSTRNDSTDYYISSFVNAKNSMQQIIVSHKKPFNFPNKDVISVGSLRNFIYKSKHFVHEDRKRMPPVSIEFSPEITIWYNYSAVSRRVEAYMCENNLISEKGKKINESSKFATGVSENDKEEWVKKVYPFSTNGSGANKRKVRAVISEFMRTRLYDDRHITLRTAWYIYSVDEKYLSDEEQFKLRELMMDSVGEMYLDSLTYDSVFEKMNSQYPDEVSKMLNVLSQLLDALFSCGVCCENIIDDFLQEDIFQKQQMGIIRGALVKRSFNDNEYEAILRGVCKKLDRGEYKYLGALIRVLTGLESNIVCSLKWEDYNRVENYGFYQFYIYRQVTNDGSETVPLKKEESYRCMPICSLLNKYLQKKLNNDKILFPNSYKDITIIEYSKNKNRCVNTPIQLSHTMNRLIKFLNIREEMIFVPDKNKGTIENNISRYYGDIFRSNFVFQCIKAGFTADEIRYLIGNKRSTTIGIHYLDFNNDAMQLIMLCKQERRSLFSAYQNQLDDEYNISENSDVTLQPKDDSPVCISVKVSPLSSGECSVKIESEFGYSIDIK